MGWRLTLFSLPSNHLIAVVHDVPGRRAQAGGQEEGGRERGGGEPGVARRGGGAAAVGPEDSRERVTRLSGSERARTPMQRPAAASLALSRGAISRTCVPGPRRRWRGLAGRHGGPGGPAGRGRGAGHGKRVFFNSRLGCKESGGPTARHSSVRPGHSLSFYQARAPTRTPMSASLLRSSCSSAATACPRPSAPLRPQAAPAAVARRSIRRSAPPSRPLAMASAAAPTARVTVSSRMNELKAAGR